jgi:hypothetical protein
VAVSFIGRGNGSIQRKPQAEEKCLMLIKKPRSSSKKVFKIMKRKFKHLN